MLGELLAAEELGGLLREPRSLIPAEDLRRIPGDAGLTEVLRQLHAPRRD